MELRTSQYEITACGYVVITQLQINILLTGQTKPSNPSTSSNKYSARLVPIAHEFEHLLLQFRTLLHGPSGEGGG